MANVSALSPFSRNSGIVDPGHGHDSVCTKPDIYRLLCASLFY